MPEILLVSQFPPLPVDGSKAIGKLMEQVRNMRSNAADECMGAM